MDGEVIRRATPDDLDALMPMAERFYSSCPWASVYAYSGEKMRAGLAALIENENAGMFVVEQENGALVGACGFYMTPVWLADDFLVAQEVFWWIDPEWRKGGAGLLLWQTAEEWAEEAGAKAIAMIRLEGMADEALHRIYERRGYTPMEHHYVRKLA